MRRRIPLGAARFRTGADDGVEWGGVEECRKDEVRQVQPYVNAVVMGLLRCLDNGNKVEFWTSTNKHVTAKRIPDNAVVLCGALKNIPSNVRAVFSSSFSRLLETAGAELLGIPIDCGIAGDA